MKYFLISFVLLLNLFCNYLTAQTNKVFQISRPTDKNPVEVSVTINPKNPDNYVAAFVAFTKKAPWIDNSVYVTEDGGMNWKKIETSNPDKRIQGDDAVAFGNDNYVYHSYLSFWGIEGQKRGEKSSGIYVSSSSDRGSNWTNRAVVIDHLNSAAPFEDKPYILVDNSKNSKYKNNVYITWTRFDVYGSKSPSDSSQIYFSRSIDSGKTFSTPMRISTTGGDCRDSSNTVEGAVPAVGPNGDVYVVWAGPKGLMFVESKDGGKTFSLEKTIGFVYHGWDFDVPGIERADGMPVVKTDLSRGKYRGTIYVNWIDDRFGDPDVFMKYSRNAGKSWSQPVRVNNDSVQNGKYQFFTWMAVDPTDGSVNIVYYDRAHYDSTKTGLTLARSINGGRSFRYFNLNQKPFYCNKNIFFGDYLGIDAYDGKVVTAYMYFKDFNNTAINGAVFNFVPGTNKIKPF